MKRILAVIMIILCFTGIFSSCSSDDPVVLFFAMEEPAGSFDPQIVSDDTASVVVRNCFEGLLRKDENPLISRGGNKVCISFLVLLSQMATNLVT